MTDDIAHIDCDGRLQTIESHCINVAAYCFNIGKQIGLANVSYIAGLLHDVGKFSNEFQNYIKKAAQGKQVHRGEVNHSSAGGIFCKEIIQGTTPIEVLLQEIISYAIISHHGLNDCISINGEDKFSMRLSNTERNFDKDIHKTIQKFVRENITQEHIDCAKSEIKKYFKQINEISDLMHTEQNENTNIKKGTQYFMIGCLQRLVCSILIDADRRDTYEFMTKNRLEEISSNELEILWARYSDKVDQFTKKLSLCGDKSKINLLRAEISNQCKSFADNIPGVYKLSIPTGGGKTISGLRYAVNHAKKYHKKHILYIAPFLSILEQNANVIRNILNDDKNILEHHSNYFIDDSNGEELINYQVNIDTWDSPVILTTMVRFLDLLFSGGTQDLRRFHQLTDAVIIIDEVQSIPVHCINLFNTMINFLHKCCNTTVILCTATQPLFERTQRKLIYSNQESIIVNELKYHDAFKRVILKDCVSECGCMDSRDITDFIEKIFDRNLLIILNTKHAVRKLYEECIKRFSDIRVFQLTTFMCAQHRFECLQTIKQLLQKNERILCISTQLIEAGVDISFQKVVRSLAGYDSIIQAAGRCNRNGEMHGLSSVYIIDDKDEILTSLGTIRDGKDCMFSVLYENKDNLLSAEVIKKYYEKFFLRNLGQMNFNIQSINNNLFDLLAYNEKLRNLYFQTYQMAYPHILSQSFKESGKLFNAIDDQNQIGIIVQYGESKEIIKRLNEATDINEIKLLLRKLQRYTVNMNMNSTLYKTLLSRHAICSSTVNEDIKVLDELFYDKDIGLTTELKLMVF